MATIPGDAIDSSPANETAVEVVPVQQSAAQANTPNLQSLKDEARNLAGTAKTAALNAANTGKDKAATALEDLVRMIDDAARTIDDKVGGKAGEYARSASTAASDLSQSLKDKNVDELVDDVKELIRKNPGVAVGAAAAAGFLLTRLLKLGGNDNA